MTSGAVRSMAVALLLAVSTACATIPGQDRVEGSGAAPVDVATDPGAQARALVLSRYAGGAGPATAITPSIIGRSPVNAEALLAGAGLGIRVVAFDRRRPVTEQHPRAGQPVPLDGVIEAWLGTPPPGDPTSAPADASASAGAPAQVVAAAAATVDDPAVTEDAAEAIAEVQPGAASYVLPPHTEGRLRINPRGLPAVPMGTELTGLASWYGPGFHGLTTACGGVYDQNGPTLATRELRCGTVVRITGPTGRTVEATVTDWGPAEWTGRRFDLSAAVFNAIAPLGAGVVPVRIVTANVPR
jgi:hypothetical protein